MNSGGDLSRRGGNLIVTKPAFKLGRRDAARILGMISTGIAIFNFYADFFAVPLFFPVTTIIDFYRFVIVGLVIEMSELLLLFPKWNPHLTSLVIISNIALIRGIRLFPQVRQEGELGWITTSVVLTILFIVPYLNILLLVTLLGFPFFMLVVILPAWLRGKLFASWEYMRPFGLFLWGAVLWASVLVLVNEVSGGLI